MRSMQLLLIEDRASSAGWTFARTRSSKVEWCCCRAGTDVVETAQSPQALFCPFGSYNFWRSIRGYILLFPASALGLAYKRKGSWHVLPAAGSLLQYGITTAERARMDATMRFSVKK